MKYIIGSYEYLYSERLANSYFVYIRKIQLSLSPTSTQRATNTFTNIVIDALLLGKTIKVAEY